MKVTPTTSFNFTDSIDGNNYNFNIVAQSKEQAVAILKANLQVIINDLNNKLE